MTFEAPGPNVLARVAENANEIIFRIALGSLALLHIEENLLETHDRGHFHKAALAHGGAEEGEGQTLLGGIHIFHGQAFAFAWNEMPVETFLAAQVEFGFFRLFGSERGEQRFGGVGDVAGILSGNAADGESGEENRKQELFHERGLWRSKRRIQYKS